MKKIINKAEDIVQDMLEGFELANPSVKLVLGYKVVKRAEQNPDKVALISGGGSGHEPAHAGFVGKGMLDAAVCGDVFASPSQVQVYQAIKEVSGSKGVLLIIKNYSGDRMNFENAAALAQEDGIRVESVVVTDDIAVQDSLYTVGRRGVAGTVFVHKIAGAASERGADLGEVKRVAEKVIAGVRSVGFALTSCTVPAKGSPTFSLAEGEMEFGVGIHGEPGIRREKIESAKTLAQRMVGLLTENMDINAPGTRVAVLINGFGATPAMELNILNKFVTMELIVRGAVIARQLVGNYMTSIDMAGASVSVLKLDDELETLLNDPADTPGLYINGPGREIKSLNFETEPGAAEARYDIETPDADARMEGNRLSVGNIRYLIDAMSACIIRNEVPFCELDSHAGDGDFGMSIAKGFRQLKAEWKDLISDADDIGAFLNACSLVITAHCGGASGPIWGSAFRAAGRAAAGKSSLSVTDFAEMLREVVRGIQATGERSFGRGAVVGDKTLIDALVPCADVWSAASDGDDMKAVFVRGAEAAREGAKATKRIVARLGRAGTVGERSLGYPDAGACALGMIFTELASALK